MAPRPKGILAQRLSGLRARWRQAFAIAPAEPLAPEDLALLERAADVIVRRGMAVPGVVLLESLGPANFIGSQALHFFMPLMEVAFPQPELQRVALLLERRDTLSRLASLIESRAGTRHS